MADVEVGKEYELIVTTYSVLCCYRVGDTLRVTSFHNSAPQFKFIRSKNFLSINADKTDESELQKAVESASRLHEFNSSVAECTSCADFKTIPGHYVIYWELVAKDSAYAPNHEVLTKCFLVMEESMNPVYGQCRVADNSVRPMEIMVVKSGTFEELMDCAISRGASNNQYKSPRYVSLTLMVMSMHFSLTAPL